LSLPMDVLKMFRKISSGQRLGELVPNAAQVTMEWRYIDLLSTIQLISFQDVKKKIQRVANEKSLQQYQELKEVLQQYQEMDPHMIYTLEAPNEINDITIDQRFRNLSKSYHPDRFIGSDKKIIGIVEEIYTLINDTHSLLQDESLREILRLRLDAEQRGEQYVGPEDSQKSELLYAQAQFLFRKRKYEDVKGVLEKAFSLNPYNWRVQTLQARVKAALGEAGKKESAEILLSIKEAKGRDRVELLFNAAELLFAAEEKERAYELFQTVVDVDDSHIDAKRYLQRRAVEKRKEKSPSSKKGFFGGLFSKKK